MSDDKKKLTVVVEGSAKGANTMLDGLGTKLGDFGAKAGKAFAAVGVAGAVGAAGVVTGLYKIGESFDEAYDKIRIGTGMTGTNLDQLKDSFKNVVSAVPTDFGKASDAVTQLVQRTGTIGPDMEAVAKQMLELSRITKTDLTANIKSSQDAFNAWGVDIGHQPALLDEMFRASQQTGVAVGDIASQIADAQPQLNAMGFSFEKSAALAATLGQAGSSLSDVMPAMGKAMAVAAKDGKSSAVVFDETFKAIKNAPTATAAAGEALKVFGAKAGPKLAEMIRSGKLSYQDLLKTMQTGGDTIIGAGKDTQDFGEKWTLIKNRVLVGLEPVATKVFNAVGEAMDKLGPYVERFAGWFNKELPVALDYLEPKAKAVFGWLRDNVPPALEKIRAKLVVVAEWLGPKLQNAFNFVMKHKEILVGILAAIGTGFAIWAISAAAAAISTLAAIAPFVAAAVAIGALVAGVIYAYKHWGWFHDAVDKVASFMKNTLWPILKGIGAWFLDDFVPALKKVGDFIRSDVIPVFQSIADKIGDVIGFVKEHWALMLGIITGPIGLAVVEVIKHWDTIKNGFTAVKDWIGEKITEIVGFIAGMPGRIASAASGLWDGFTSGATGAANMVIDAVNAIIGAIDSFQIHESGVHQSIFGKDVTIVPAFDWNGFNIPKLGHFGGDSSPAYAGAREFGGPVMAGKAYLVGEKRAELFVPNSNGAIVPRVPTGGSTGGSTTVVHQTNVYRVGERDLAKFLRTIIKREDAFAGAGA